MPLAARRGQRGQRREVADVLPAEPTRHDGDPAGGGGRLGDGVVDRDPRADRASALQATTGRRRSRAGRRELRVVLGQQVQQHRGAHQEHARVPAVLPRRDVGRAPARRPASPRTPDTAQRRGESRQPARRGGCSRSPTPATSGSIPMVTSQPCARDLRRLTHAGGEGGAVGDHVVGGERADQGVRVLPLELGGRQPDGGHRVRGDGSASTRATCGQLAAYGVLVGRPGHDHDPVARPGARAGRPWPGSGCARCRSGRAGTWASEPATAATAGCPRHRPGPRPTGGPGPRSSWRASCHPTGRAGATRARMSTPPSPRAPSPSCWRARLPATRDSHSSRRTTTPPASAPSSR